MKIRRLSGLIMGSLSLGSLLAVVIPPAPVVAGPVHYPGYNGKLVYSKAILPQTQINVTTLANGQTQQIMSIDGGIPSVEIFPSGNKIAYIKCAGLTSECDVFVANLDGTAEVKVTDIKGYLNYLEISPTGDTLYFAQSGKAYTVNVDGSNLTSIAPGLAGITYASYSPDGTKIALFTSTHGYTNYEIYVVGIDGSNLTRLTNNTRNDNYPRWSPDGSKIVFYSNRATTTNYDIYVMNADGSNQTRLTTAAENDQYPKWTPDGTKIVFQSWRDTIREIYVMDSNGSNQARLTNSVGMSHSHSISHDGTQVTYRTCDEDIQDAIFSCDIDIVGIDGTNTVNISNSSDTDDIVPSFTPDNTAVIYTSISRYAFNKIFTRDLITGQIDQVTHDFYHDSNPAWSPDGSKIAFLRKATGETDFSIYTINADGSNQQRVTTGVNVDTLVGPDWSPDGSKLTFEGATQNIFIVNADGTNLTQLTAYATGSSYAPQFSPDGTKIAFEHWDWSSPEDDTGVYIVNIDGSNGELLASDRPNGDGPFHWSPDGQFIVYDNYDDTYQRQVEVVEVATNNVTALTDNPNESHTCYSGFAWSPDSKYLAACHQDENWDTSTLAIINRQTGVSQDINLQDQGLNDFYDVLWSPDGKQLLIDGYDAQNNWKTFVYTLASNHLEVVSEPAINIEKSSWARVLNTSPTTANDSANVAFNTPTLINVLANDTDEEALDGQYLTISAPPLNGTASIESGKVKYTPNSGFKGADQLTYQVCDSFWLDQKCATAVVGVTVQNPGAPTLRVAKIGDTSFNSSTNKYTTSNSKPTFSGSASPGSEIRVEIHSDPILLTTTADQNGNWSVAPSANLPLGEHTVYISATLNGVATELDSFVLAITTSGEIPNTGANSWPLRVGGVICIVLGGVATLYHRRSLNYQPAKLPSLYN